MRNTIPIVFALFLSLVLCKAQVPYREIVPDVRYSVAGQLFDSGQIFAAQRIVSDCLRHIRWDENFSPEVHKTIPRIVATMKGDEMYMDFVGEIKHKFNQGILSEEDVAPFKNEFSRIHIMGD